MNISPIERNLILDALATAASRHESLARVQKYGRRHDLEAAAMRALRLRMLQTAEGERLVLRYGAAITLPVTT